ncbi:CBS domain-containing protein [Asanoa sp. NPDC049518]|uniref:CBS domain-containing protein n=1 Tax=unclassified Asanoa TaxID=2685164 RepID=UPI0034281D99
MKAIYLARGEDVPPLTSRRVRQIMSTPPVCVAAGATLGDALRAMVRGRRRHLVVVADDGTCRGVVADRAIVAAWAQGPSVLDTVTVESALDPTAAVVDEQATVAVVARLMRRVDIDAVAVVDANLRPIGIVTGSDIVALLAA